MRDSVLSVKRIASKKPKRSWKLCNGLRPVQISIPHITHFISNLFASLSLSGIGGQTYLNQWTATCPARFHQVRMEVLLAVECSAIEGALEKKDNFHRDERAYFQCEWCERGAMQDIISAHLYIIN